MITFMHYIYRVRILLRGMNNSYTVPVCQFVTITDQTRNYQPVNPVAPWKPGCPICPVPPVNPIGPTSPVAP